MGDWKHFVAADGKVILHTSLEISELHQSFTARSQRGIVDEDQNQK